MAQPTTFQPADSHLVAERHDVLVRGRLLARLTDSLGRGIQDPELLYLGARFAVSMGQGCDRLQVCTYPVTQRN